MASPLPDGWESCLLGDLVARDGISYGVVQPGATTEHGIPIVRVTDVRDGHVVQHDVKRIDPGVEAAYSRSRLRGGEVLLSLVGSVGEVAVVPEALSGWNVARAIGVIRPTPSVGADWIAASLKSPALQHYMNVWKTTTVQETLNLRDVARLPIVLPPRRERDRILHVLGALDDKIELNRRMNETLEAIVGAIFTRMFETAPLRPFTEIVEVLTGGTPSTSIAEYWGGGIPWFSVVDTPAPSDVFVLDTERTLSQAGLANSAAELLPAGTTIITARGTVGNVALMANPMAINQSCYGLQGRDGYGSVFTLYSTRRLVAELRRRSHGSVFDTITLRTFDDLEVPAPGPEETSEFEDAARPYLERILANLREARTLAALRDALLPKLISGELRIRGAERTAEQTT